MVHYECYRCGYVNNDKAKIRLHVNRKNTCKYILNNINIDECRQYILDGLTFKEYIKKIENTQKTPHISSIKYPQSTPINDIKKEYECESCNKCMSSYKNLWRHLKTCKEKKKDEDVKDSMNKLVVLLNEQLNEKNQQLCKKDEQLNDFKKEIKKEFKKELTKRDNELKKELIKKDEQLKKQNKQIDELIKKAGINISTTNVMNNIKLLSYSETDRSHLTDKDIIKCLKHSNFCIPHLIEKIHFDKNKPQNHNVYISNLKNKYIMIYDGNKWVCKDRDEQLMNLIDDNEGIFEYKIEEWIENGNKFPKMMKKFNTYVGIKDNNMVINKIKDEIKLLLYNNRNVVNTDILAINNCKNSNLMNC
mgnify:CR=1 FL=1